LKLPPISDLMIIQTVERYLHFLHDLRDLKNMQVNYHTCECEYRTSDSKEVLSPCQEISLTAFPDDILPYGMRKNIISQINVPFVLLCRKACKLNLNGLKRLL
jgi:hypothetical protein